MTGTFAVATSVRRRTAGDTSTQSDAGVVFDAEVKPGWDINGNANGGYLLAIAGRAMAETAGRPPLTVTAHYLKPGPAGPCEVEVSTVRSGRRLATMTGSLRMDGTEIIRLLGTFGDQTPGGPSYTREAPVDLPSYEDSAVPPPPTEGPKPAMFERLRIRLRPEDVGFRTGQPTGEARIDGWFAFADEEPIDAIALLLARRRVPAGGVQHRTAGGVGADRRVDRARPRRPGARPAALLVRARAPSTTACSTRRVRSGIPRERSSPSPASSLLRRARSDLSGGGRRSGRRCARAANVRSRGETGAGDPDGGRRRDRPADDGLRALAEDHDRPAVAAGVSFEPPVGVDGDGMADGLEHRQVARRVAVRIALRQHVPVPVGQFAHRLDLALAVAERTVSSPVYIPSTTTLRRLPHTAQDGAERARARHVAAAVGPPGVDAAAAGTGAGWAVDRGRCSDLDCVVGPVGHELHRET